MKTKEIKILDNNYKIIFVESKEESEQFCHLDDTCDGITLSNQRIILVRAYENDPIPYSEFEDGAICLDYSIKRILRHEILHVFLNESGLRACVNPFYQAWSRNEEMIDWFAIQIPKIVKVYEELNIL